MTEYRRLSDAFKGPRVKPGQVAWQAARLAQAQLQLVDGELIALESDGSLALTRTRRKASTCGRRWRA